MQAAFELRQRAALGDKLCAEQRREDLQDQFFAEPDDEIGAGCKYMRCAGVETMIARDVERDRQPLRGIGAPGAEAFRVDEAGQCHQHCKLNQTKFPAAILRDARLRGLLRMRAECAATMSTSPDVA